MSTVTDNQRPRGIRWKRHLFGLLLAGVCLWLLLTRVSVADLRNTWRSVAPGYAIVGFGVVLVSYLLKALRFKILLGPAAPFGKLFGVTIAQNVIAQVVPARAGDLSYVVLVRHTGMASVGYALASLLICRFVDLVIILAMYIGSLCVLKPELPLFTQAAWFVGGVMTCGAVAAAALIIGRRRVVDAFERLLTALRLLKLRPVAYLWREVRGALPGVAELHPVRHMLPMLVTSVFIWAATLCWIWLIWRAVDVALGPAQLLFIFSFTHILSLLPIFFFGGVGTGDAVNATVLVSFSIGQSQAVAFALCNRVLSLLYQVGLSLLAVVLLNRGRTDNPREGADEG